MTSHTIDRPLRTFGLVWLGQLIALAATAVTDFVLSVWVLLTTDSVLQFSVISVCIVGVNIVVSPFIGVAADRFNRRTMLIASNSTAATVGLAVAGLDALDVLAVWHVYVAAAVVSACTATHFIVCQSLVGTLIPPERQGRAMGMLMLVPGFQIAAPVVGATLFDNVGISGVALIQTAVTLLAALNLLRIQLPVPENASGVDSNRPRFLQDLKVGLQYLRDRPLLLRYTVLVVTVIPFGMGLASLMIRPLVLSFASLSELSQLTFFGGLGFLAGSLVMTFTGGPSRKAYGVWGCLVLGGVLLVGHAWRPSYLLVAVVAPLFLFCVPLLTACSQTLMIRKLEPQVIGRISGVSRTVGQLATGAAYLAAGPLVERLLGPAMDPGGALADSLGAAIGVGEGRGVAAVYLLAGVLFLAVGIYGWSDSSLRAIDTILPDAGGPPPSGPATSDPPHDAETPTPDVDDQPSTQPQEQT